MTASAGLSQCLRHGLLAVVTLAVFAAQRAESGEPLPPRTGDLRLQEATRAAVQFRSLSAEVSRWLSPDGLLEVATGDLLAWGVCPAPVVGPSADLHGGGVLAAQLTAWTEDEVTLTSPLLGQVRLPHAAVAAWQASAGVSPTPPEPGLLALDLTNGDRLLATHFNLPEDAASGRAVLATQPDQSRSIAIPRNRLQAISRGRRPAADPSRQLPTAMAMLGLADGSRLAVEQVEELTATDSGSLLAWPVVAGEVPLPPLTVPPGAVSGLVATGGHAIPLAWLTAASAEQIPLYGPPWPQTIGTTLSGGPLEAGGQRAFTGFGLHAKARVAYELPLPLSPQQLLATVAIDDVAGRQGSVVVRIRGGGGPGTATIRFESSVLRGGDPPLDLCVDLTGCTWLELSVDPTDDGDVLDRTVWLEPRLVTLQTSRTGLRGPSPGASGASLETSPGRR